MADKLTIGGTGNALGTARLLAEAYTRRNPADQITVLPSLGSSGAIKASAAGKLDLGLSSRPLKDDELAAGLLATEYARSPTVFAVAAHTRIGGVSVTQMAQLYAGQLSTWPDGTPARPIIRQAGDDNTLQIKKLSPAMDSALTLAEQRPGLPTAFTDQETVDKIESIPGAVGVTTVALIQSEGRRLRALQLDGVEPTEANCKSGAYPTALVKRFYLVTSTTPGAGVQRFIQFIGSAEGTTILKQTGHWTP
ncbi:substrate-binding domain-containing protein [Rhodoferax sp. U11-2br]|uniref:substrate-binding domain-containing protein n=1 Tax=Rhodoferax sp. U11-2br TaxID=2838878 RepID=UPI001BEC8BCA|nr:substrate-binding domain-containing protein [Rhodoferax sp. U11-2br]MBT3066974.1 substrate-binding domain-containing protein [Rhodoferax sp. U11-2br]